MLITRILFCRWQKNIFLNQPLLLSFALFIVTIAHTNFSLDRLQQQVAIFPDWAHSSCCKSSGQQKLSYCSTHQYFTLDAEQMRNIAFHSLCKPDNNLLNVWCTGKAYLGKVLFICMMIVPWNINFFSACWGSSRTRRICSLRWTNRFVRGLRAHHHQQHCHCDHQQIVIVFASISVVMIIMINITTWT